MLFDKRPISFHLTGFIGSKVIKASFINNLIKNKKDIETPIFDRTINSSIITRKTPIAIRRVFVLQNLQILFLNTLTNNASETIQQFYVTYMYI